MQTVAGVVKAAQVHQRLLIHGLLFLGAVTVDVVLHCWGQDRTVQGSVPCFGWNLFVDGRDLSFDPSGHVIVVLIQDPFVVFGGATKGAGEGCKA